MNPDLGDSAIVETYGLGALAVAASPIVGALGRAGAGRRSTRIDAELRAIAAGESPDIRFPDGRAGDPRHRRAQGRRDAHLAARAHRDRAPAARRRADRRRRHAPAAGRLRPRGARRSLTRAEEVHRELRAALLAGEFPYGQRLVEEQLAERFAPAARRCARRCGGWRATGTSCATAPAACGRTRRGCRRCASSTTCASCSRTSRCAPPTRSGSTPLHEEWLELRAEHDDVAGLRLRRRGASTRRSRAPRGNRADRALPARHQRAHPRDPDPRLHDAGPDRGDDRGAPGDPRGGPRRARRRRRRADARAHRALAPRWWSAAWASCSRACSRRNARELSIATNAFAAARERLDAQVDRPARAAAGVRGLRLAARRRCPRSAGCRDRRDRRRRARARRRRDHLRRARPSRRWRGSREDEWTAFVRGRRRGRAGRGARPRRRAARRPPARPAARHPGLGQGRHRRRAACRTRCGSDAYDAVPGGRRRRASTSGARPAP